MSYYCGESLMIFRSLLIASLFMSVFISVEPVNADVDQVKVDVQKVSPHRVYKDIRNKKGNDIAVLLYASWCPVCVKKMPSIIDIERSSPGSVIAVSLDDNRQDFKRYIKRFDNLPFNALIIDGPEWKLANKLKGIGIKPWDSIPQVILINADGKVVEQGNLSSERIAEFVSQ